MNRIDRKIEKSNQGIGVIRRLYKYFPRKDLLTSLEGVFIDFLFLTRLLIH